MTQHTGVRATGVKLDANGRMELSKRTLAEAWGIEVPAVTREPIPESVEPKPVAAPEPRRIPFAGFDPRDRRR